MLGTILRIGRSAVGLPPELSDSKIRSHYTDKLISANVNALVHLHLSTRILEYLVQRRIVNFGEGITKTDEANRLMKSNMAFIDEITKNHEAGKVNDFASFQADIQKRTQDTVDKLVAILMTGDRRLGNKDSELAAPVSYPVKLAIALVVDDFFRLFNKPNPAKEQCDHFIVREQEVQGGEHFDDFYDYMKDGIKKGNGTRSYKFIRIGAAGIFSLSRDGEGVDAVQGSVNDSVVKYGALENEELDVSDIPEFEEEYENLNCLFNNEDVRLKEHGAALAALSYVMIRFITENLELGKGNIHEIQKVVSDAYPSNKIMSAAERDMAGDKPVTEGLDKARIELEAVIRGFIDGSDGRNATERASDLRRLIRFIGDLMDGLASLSVIRNKGNIRMERGTVVNDESKSINEQFVDEISNLADGLTTTEEAKDFAKDYTPTEKTLDEDMQNQIRAFAVAQSTFFKFLQKEGIANLSDNQLPPTESRIPYVQAAMTSMQTLQQDVKDNLISGTPLDKPREGGLSFNETFDWGQRFLLFFNVCAIFKTRPPSGVDNPDEVLKDAIKIP